MGSLAHQQTPRLRSLAGFAVALRGLFNVAGGVPYHVAALRYRRDLWVPYHEAVARVLADWAPPQRQLVIVGPSAGWNLPLDFLQRFDHVVAVEPDPLARWLLRRRFTAVTWQMDGDDYFTPHAAGGWTANLDRLFERYPDSALLFSEFLGQMVALYPDSVAADSANGVIERAAFTAWKAHLRQRLHTRTFCSLHDRWVCAAPPIRAPSGPVDLDAGPPPGVWDATAWVADAWTAQVVPRGEQRLLLWHRLPDRWHAMAAVWARAPLIQTARAPQHPD